MFRYVYALLCGFAAILSPVHASAESMWGPPAGDKRGRVVTVNVPGVQESGRPVVITGGVGLRRPAPGSGGSITRTVISIPSYLRVTQDNQLWSQALFPRQITRLRKVEDLIFFAADSPIATMEYTTNYLPAGACIYALDGYWFGAQGSDDGDRWSSTIHAYLYMRPKTDYIFVEYLDTPAETPCSAENPPAYAVIMPMAQFTAAHQRWQQRKIAEDQDATRRNLAALGALVVGFGLSALANAKPAPDEESIVMGKGGCPMFTERHHDGMCW